MLLTSSWLRAREGGVGSTFGNAEISAQSRAEPGRTGRVPDRTLRFTIRFQNGGKSILLYIELIFTFAPKQVRGDHVFRTK